MTFCWECLNDCKTSYFYDHPLCDRCLESLQKEKEIMTPEKENPILKKEISELRNKVEKLKKKNKILKSMLC